METPEDKYWTHSSAVDKIAELLSLDRKVVEFTVCKFFSSDGLLFFMKLLRTIRIKNFGNFIRTRRAGQLRNTKKFRKYLSSQKYYYNRVRSRTGKNKKGRIKI